MDDRQVVLSWVGVEALYGLLSKQLVTQIDMPVQKCAQAVTFHSNKMHRHILLFLVFLCLLYVYGHKCSCVGYFQLWDIELMDINPELHVKHIVLPSDKCLTHPYRL